MVLVGTAFWGPAQAQPKLLTVTPADGATSVATTTPVVFTFDRAMFTSSIVLFTNATSGAMLLPSVDYSSAWSAGNTVVTCTPLSQWPADSVLTWNLEAVFDTSYKPVTGTTTGSFSTGTGGGGTTGYGTNAITSFLLSKINTFHQTSDAAPAPTTAGPYAFLANVVLASNRTAYAISLTVPSTGAISNLAALLEPDNWQFLFYSTNQALVESTFPQGEYFFTVDAALSNQTVAVNFPTTMAQPNAPHLTDFTAAQTIAPAQDFTLTWDAFAGATATDLLQLLVSLDGTNVVQTPSYIGTNALPGTTVSYKIPAGTLLSNTTYDAELIFVRGQSRHQQPGLRHRGIPGQRHHLHPGHIRGLGSFGPTRHHQRPACRRRLRL